MLFGAINGRQLRYRLGPHVPISTDIGIISLSARLIIAPEILMKSQIPEQRVFLTNRGWAPLRILWMERSD